MEHSVLSLMIFIPIVGMAAILCIPSQAQDLIKKAALVFTLPPLVLGIWLFQHFNRATPDLQFVVKVPWIAAYNIEYFVGVDGISISMVLLTAFLCPICILASWALSARSRAISRSSCSSMRLWWASSAPWIFSSSTFSGN